MVSTALTAAFAGAPAAAQSLPTNGQVVAGSATIQTNAQSMAVNTTTQRTVIDWSSFSVAADHQLTFNQPSASAITVNRVTGADPSKIFGTIASNGQVVIANPNGIWFGPSARVDVAGVVASAGRISDQAVGSFMAGGALAIGSGLSGATVINDGTITARDGGFAALVAPGVRNTGTITARLGRVALASGATATVDFYGDGLINLAVAGLTDSAPLDSAVENSGRIYAEGGQVRLSASVAQGLLDNVINMTGVIEAQGVSTAGGVVELLGGTGGVAVAGRVDVSGTQGQDGGRITVQAGDASARDGVFNLTGTLDAGSVGGAGGTIEADARFIFLGGSSSANGASGGTIAMNGVGITQAGLVSATGAGGAGGAVTLTAEQNIIQTASAVTTASSTSGTGGRVTVQVDTGRLFSSATLSATGLTGGTVQLLGDDIALAAATVDASGAYGGGAVLVGGDLHGAGAKTAATVLVNAAVSLRADAGERGNGGRVVVWSNRSTDYRGSASARGGASGGDGGMIEVSSADTLNYAGSGDASAIAGAAGKLLLDPKNIVISETTGGLATLDLIDPNAGTGTLFGDTTAQLSNGRIVVTKPGDTVGGAANAGSVYFFDATNGALLATFQGSHAGDKVGAGAGKYYGLTFFDPSLKYDSVSSLPTPDTTKAFAILSPNWNGNRGAVTWVQAGGMVSGVLGAGNSLVGSSANDLVGAYGTATTTTIDILSSGNAVVRSPGWGDMRGAVTFMTASSGATGVVSAGNSIVGTTTATANGTGWVGDILGYDGIVALANGDFVVRSGWFNKGGGALTFGNGVSGFGFSGAVSSSNSVVGSGGVAYSATDYTSPGTPLVYKFYGGDDVGRAGITALSNGDFVITSTNWGHGRGAVTYVAQGAFNGLVSTSNSMVGQTKGTGDTSDGTDDYYTDRYGNRGWYGGDTVGSDGIVELSGHAFVIMSPSWSSNRGAVTYISSTTRALSGRVNSVNSLIGSTAGAATGYNGFHQQSMNGGDSVGWVTALANGNYVVTSTRWNSNAGAVTLMDGTTGLAVIGSSTRLGDAVSSNNSIVGDTSNDQVGQSLTKLAGTSDIVIATPFWHSGRGAATRLNTTTGLVGNVSSTNSLVGTTAYEVGGLGGDNVGNSVVALPNGAFVVLSPNWNKIRGAATFVAAGGATTGTVSTANSFVGTTGAEGNAVYCNSCDRGQPGIFGGDLLGSGGITILPNGNFVMSSPDWSQQRGALTFVNGATGALVDGTSALVGSISSANSLVGTQAGTRYVSQSYLSGYGDYRGKRYWVGGDRVGENATIGGTPAVQVIGSSLFLAANPSWHSRTGAVTLGKVDGTLASGGVFAGTVSASNSLVGSTASTTLTPGDLTRGDVYLRYDGDQVGTYQTLAMSDGRIGIFSPKWSASRGAITLMGMATGVQGVVGSGNSFVGSQSGDAVGDTTSYSTVTLANGTMVFANPSWDNNTGAVTQIAAGAAFTGTLAATNSLVGASSGDYFGSQGVIALPGSRYLINSSSVNGGQGAVSYHDSAVPLTGTMNATNSFTGGAGMATSSGIGYALKGASSLLLNFSDEGSGRVVLGFGDATGWTYARAQGQTMTIAPSLIAATLAKGTSVVLQANNDITISDAIAAAGSSGNLTLQAGRSILGNAGITLGTGNLTLLANDTVAHGVIGAERYSGNAVVTFASGVAINTAGAVSITLGASTDKPYNDAGDITLGAITAGSVDVRNLGSASGGLTLDGVITATGSGNAIVLATGGAFVNNAGAAALLSGAGRFLVYSADPRGNTLGGLTAGGKFYGYTLAANAPSSVAGAASLLLYSVVPTLTLTGNGSVGYGDPLSAVTPTVTGLIDGDTLASAVTGTAGVSSTYRQGDSVGGSYALNVSQGTMTSPLGYGLSFASGTVTVTKKTLTLGLTGTVSKTYDQGNVATLAAGNYQLSGLYGSDAIAISKTSGTYATANAASNLGVTVSLQSSDYTAGSGTSLSNYTLPTGSISGSIGTIRQAPLTLTGVTAQSRSYNGGRGASLTGGTLSGVLSGDSVGLNAGTGAFGDANVGTGKRVTVSGYSLTGASAGNYSIAQPTGITADITAKAISLTGVTASNRVYDGSLNVALSGGNLSGVEPGDVVSFAGGTGQAAAKDVGSHGVTVSGYSLAGASAGNYILSAQPSGLTVTISALSVALSGVAAVNRDYDRTTAVALTTGSLTGVLGNDVVSLTQGTGSMADANTGINKSVTVTGFALGGADGGNYTLTGVPTTLSVDISAKVLTLTGVVAQDRVYNGSQAIALSGGTLSGVFNGDTVSFSSGAGSAATRNVGSQSVSASGYALGGTDAGNYRLASQPNVSNVTISALALTLSGVSAINRDYDGSTVVGLTTGNVSGVLLNDSVTLSQGSGSVASKAAGLGKAVTVTGFGLSGADAGNYTLTGVPTALTVDISAKLISLTGVTASGRAYDGTRTISLSGGSLSGVVGSDAVIATGGVGLAASKNAGQQSVTVSGYTLSGSDAANYSLGGQPGALSTTIGQASVTLSGVGAVNRDYDGTTAVALTTGSISGVLANEAVILTQGAGSIANANAGLGKAVSVTGFGLSGADASNYNLVGVPTALSVDIAPKMLSVSGVTAQSRAYDGTRVVALSGGTVSGLVGNDVVALSAGTGLATSKNVGTQAITVSGYTLSGADAGNYTVSVPSSGLTATISPLAVAMSAVNATNRAYDGTTTVALTTATIAGLLASDAVSLVQGSGRIATRDIGLGKSVTVSGFGLNGADAGNYLLTGVPTALTVDISAKALSLTGVTAQNRTYDGTTAVLLSGGIVSGVVGNDVVFASGGIGTAASKNAGTQAVTVSGFTLSGSDAGNYSLSGQPTGLTTTISALPLTVSGVSAVNRAYDGTTVVTLAGGTVSGILANDAVSLVQGVGSLSDRNVGSGKIVSVSGFGLNGADAGNYSLGGVPTSLSVDISAKALSVSGIAAQNRAYDGTTRVALTGGSLSGIVNGDVVALVQGFGTLQDKHVGLGKSVGISGLGISGTDARNYVLTTMPTTLSVDIAARALTLTGVTAVGRAYDGTTAVALSGGTLSGVVGGDSVSASGGTGAVASKNAGTQSVTVSGYTLGGTDAGDYALAGQPSGLTAVIDPARLSVTLAAGSVSKTYDGTTAAALTAGSYRVQGLAPGESISILKGAGAFAGTGAGANLAVTVTLSAADYAAGAGTTLSNYALFTGSVTASAGSILPAALLVVADDKSYRTGEQMPVLTASYTGFMGNDTAASIGFSPTLTTVATTQSSPGVYAIVAGGGTLANYTVTYRAGALTVTAAPVTIPLQALVANQPVQAVIASPVSVNATDGQVTISTGAATAFIPLVTPVPLTVGAASATLPTMSQSAIGANDYANSFLSSIKLESRR